MPADASTPLDASVPDAALPADDASITPDAALDDDAGAPCPAPPADLVELTLPDGYGHPIAARLASGQTGSIEVPAFSDDHASEQITFGESAGGANSPQPVTIDISISRCKGVIHPDTTSFCNVHSTNGAYNSVVYFARPFMTLDDEESVNARGYCWAPAAQGPWFVNMRWTYESCAFGSATCGFMVQRNPGPY